MRRLAAAAAIASLTLLAFPAAYAAAAPQRTSAGPVLAAADANDLAQTLADAESTQHVCYGWIVNVDDASGGPSGTDAGSSKDPTTADPALQCRKYVVLRASVNYVSDSSESNDSASYSIESNLSRPPTPNDLDQLGVGPNAILSDNNDTALINSVEALPLIVAEKGEAKSISPDLTPKPANSPDHPTGSVSHTGKTVGIIIGVIFLVIGLIWLLLEILHHRRRGSRREPPGTPPPGAPPGPAATQPIV